MNYKVLENSKGAFAIMLNPAAYDFKGFSGRPDKNALLALNANYSWMGMPIGIAKSEGKIRASIPAKSQIRPCLCIRKSGHAIILHPESKHFKPEDYSFIAQAGPMLLQDRQLVYREAIKKEEFRDDAVRKTVHVAVGVNRVGKLFVLYMENSTMNDLAVILRRLGATEAMKMDGGHISALIFNPEDWDDNKAVALGNKGRIPLGLQFTQRPKPQLGPG